METIHKYEIDLTLHVNGECYIVRMPSGAKILHVDSQKPRHIHLWALVSTEAKTEDRPILVVGTGGSMSNIRSDIKLKHLGTVEDGPFIWHVFELKVRS